MTQNARTALVLPGGGARAAYQAGVLSAICEMLPDPTENPFPILCGTSAGAINAATLACHAENFRAAVENLNEVWRNMRAHHVYRADPFGVAASGARWLSSLAARSLASILLRKALMRALSGPHCGGGGSPKNRKVSRSQPMARPFAASFT